MSGQQRSLLQDLGWKILLFLDRYWAYVARASQGVLERRLLLLLSLFLGLVWFTKWFSKTGRLNLTNTEALTSSFAATHFLYLCGFFFVCLFYYICCLLSSRVSSWETSGEKPCLRYSEKQKEGRWRIRSAVMRIRRGVSYRWGRATGMAFLCRDPAHLQR